jgi:hypothetical protein
MRSRSFPFLNFVGVAELLAGISRSASFRHYALGDRLYVSHAPS